MHNELCRWCGIPITDHTPGQLEAGEYFYELLGPEHAWNAEPRPSPAVKLSKSTPAGGTPRQAL